MKEFAMKIHMTTAALMLAAAPAFGQMTGVSNPDSATISATDDSATQTAPVDATGATVRRPLTEKPSAAVSAPAADSPAVVVYGPYVPYTGPKAASGNLASTDAADADVSGSDLSTGNVDSQIITSLPESEGELREGTLLKTQIRETLSTSSTIEGSRFTATVMEPVEKNGKVVIPAGSILEGRVTEVHGGRRITGAAALHLETSNVTLPDGTHYVVHAQLIDTSRSEFKVTDEGTLKRKDHAKEMLAVASLTTGGAAAAGAVIGGGVGAIVGAGIGAGVSTVIWLKQDRQATLPKDVQLVFSLTAPMVLRPLSPLSAPAGNGAAGAQ
jgi:hypothetical protein